MKHILVAILLGVLATQGVAHSKINTTSPVDGASIDAAPASIDMSFAKRIRLTRVELHFAGEPATPLDLGDQTGFGTEFSLPIRDAGNGGYRIEWRGLGGDGHVMQGTFSFQVE